MTAAVCLFTDSSEPSGVGEHMLTLAAALRGRYHLSFVCPPLPGGIPFIERAARMGLATLPLGVHDQDAAWYQLRGWLRERAVDIFHCHAGVGWEGHSGITAARAAGVPAVVRTEHLPDVITEPRERDAYRRVLALTDRLICVAEAVRDTFVAQGVPLEKTRVVRNGIQPQAALSARASVRAQLGLPAAAHVVLTVGRMTEQKGHQHLIAALPAVLAHVPDTSTVLVGVGPLEDDLRARVRALRLEHRVCFAGRRDDVPALMAAADLFVLPSLFEGLPLVVLEAMAAALPVVGTRVCGTAEAVVDGVTGRLVPAQDPRSLAEAMCEALEQPERAAAWGAAGRRRVAEAFSAARMAQETAAVYDELLHPGRRPAPTTPGPLNVGG